MSKIVVTESTKKHLEDFLKCNLSEMSDESVVNALHGNKEFAITFKENKIVIKRILKG